MVVHDCSCAHVPTACCTRVYNVSCHVCAHIGTPLRNVKPLLRQQQQQVARVYAHAYSHGHGCFAVVVFVGYA